MSGWMVQLVKGSHSSSQSDVEMMSKIRTRSRNGLFFYEFILTVGPPVDQWCQTRFKSESEHIGGHQRKQKMGETLHTSGGHCGIFSVLKVNVFS